MVWTKAWKTIWFLLLVSCTLGSCKVYKRCELAKELKSLGAPLNQLAQWVCIAAKESSYNTSAVGKVNNNGSKDFGIFQINNKYWCSPSGKGCKLSCSKLLDADISNDFTCARTIHEETKRFSGDGFTAWSVYKPHCKGSKADSYIKGCF